METTTPNPTITITARCFCRTFDLPLTFPISNLPIPIYLCLCRSCRLVTGSLCFSDITLSQQLTSTINPSTYNLTPYKTSPFGTRYFCSTCGAHCLFHDLNKNEYSIATALLNRTEGVVEWKGTKHSRGSAEDARLRNWLRRDGFRHFLDGEGSIIHTGKIPLNTSKQNAGLPSDILPASCHCKSVSFHITRPDTSSTQLSTPYPDLIHPYNSTHPDILSNPNSDTWWLRSSHPSSSSSKTTKYLAGLCTCPTCVLTSGAPFQPWAFIPSSNIFVPSSSSVPPSPPNLPLPDPDPEPESEPLHLTPTTSNLHSLHIFTSTHPSTHRAFCARCGATVFWFSSGERGGLVDVSVGLLGAETGEWEGDTANGYRGDGAREGGGGRGGEGRGRESVENWLEWWTQRVSFSELAEEAQKGSEVLVRVVEDGLRDWGEERIKEGK
ncbi:hypothetical protein ACMFMG_000516 [Clarireedia jacksonii]